MEMSQTNHVLHHKLIRNGKQNCKIIKNANRSEARMKQWRK